MTLVLAGGLYYAVLIAAYIPAVIESFRRPVSAPIVRFARLYVQKKSQEKS